MNEQFIVHTKSVNECYHADFLYALIDGDLLVVLDMDLGNRSVTNDAEWVLKSLKAQLPAKLPATIIYRDSTGDFDGLEHADGVFTDFYPLNTTNFRAAIYAARNRHEDSPDG